MSPATRTYDTVTFVAFRGCVVDSVPTSSLRGFKGASEPAQRCLKTIMDASFGLDLMEDARILALATLLLHIDYH
uniref:Phospholipid scramblase n=1 Tax=Panagrellus redivivus TaxID=6233 RepID=A0A7E4VIX8_PANRE